jgi:hypothetical protein
MVAKSCQQRASSWKAFTIVVLCCLAFLQGYAQSNCKLRKEEDGIKVYTCHVDTSRFKSILTEFDIRCSFEDIKKAVLEIDHYPKWQFNTIEGTVLRHVSDNEKIYRTVIEAPWPVSDRDMVVHLRLLQNPHELLIFTDSEAGIKNEVRGLVRVPFSHAQWTVTLLNENTLHVKYQMLIDPGGSVPAWLVNWACANGPLQSFQNLKKLLGKK